MLRILSCNSMRSIDYITVGKRSIEKVEDEYQERQETYLSGLWTFIELIQKQLQKNQIHKEGLVYEILEQKLRQLQQEYKLVSKKPQNLNFRKWQKHMVDDWFVPVAQHYSAKRYEAMHGYKPRNPNKNTSSQVEREIEFDQLSYCQLK